MQKITGSIIVLYLLLGINLFSQEHYQNLIIEEINILQRPNSKITIDYPYTMHFYSAEVYKNAMIINNFLHFNPEINLIIEFHTNTLGNEDANLKKSQNDAYFLERFLLWEDTPVDRFKVVGLGEKFAKKSEEITSTRIEIFSILNANLKSKFNDGQPFFYINEEKCLNEDYWGCYNSYKEFKYENENLLINKPAKQLKVTAQIIKFSAEEIYLRDLTNSYNIDTIQYCFNNNYHLSKKVKENEELVTYFQIRESEKKTKVLKDFRPNQIGGFYRFNVNMIYLGIFNNSDIHKEVTNLDFENLCEEQIHLVLSEEESKKLKKWNRKNN